MPALLLSLFFAITLPTGWRIAPAGEAFPLGTFPTHAALLPDGNRVLVLEAGFAPPALHLIDLKTRASLAKLPLPDAASNFAFDPATSTAYIPTGHGSSVHVAVLEGNRFVAKTAWPLEWPNQEFPRSYANSIALSAKHAAVCETIQNSVAILDRQTGAVLRRLKVPSPAFAAFHQGHLYVLGASTNVLRTFNAETYSQTSEVPISRGPAHLLAHDGKLYIAAAYSNSLDILSLADPGNPRPESRIHLAPAPNWPVGVTPSSLSVDAVTGRLYITCSDSNAVAVLDLTGRRGVNFIPTAWYPTNALPLPGQALLVLNGKGERSYPNPQGPNPTIHRSMTPQPPTEIEYVGLIQKGSARIVRGLTAESLRQQTRTYFRLTPPLDRTKPTALPTAIKHVVYIMKENRTYDQVLGDLPRGAADPSLCLFPRKITPNHHKLAEQFVLLDHFHVNADVSSEGWMWTSAAIAPHFVVKRWPAAYAGRAKPQVSNGEKDPLLQSPTGYLWSSALRKGLRVRNYGFFVSGAPNPKTADPELIPITHPAYPGYDPSFPDLERARLFIEDWDKLEAVNQTPHLSVMVLPNDHTWGTAPGKLTPYASMADNDAALGKIVEHLSQSKLWPNLAIFVLEDDAQNGPDHLDSHRSPAYVISPYTQRNAVDSTFYNTTSMIRTIGLLLNLPPLTQYDATAAPMVKVFQAKPDLTPYKALPAEVSLTSLNPARGPLAKRGANLDLSAPDRIDDAEMNAILWQALKQTPPPPPTRAAYLRSPARTTYPVPSSGSAK
jgi:DNA-binding beta-propeller fold protein YncE